MSTRMRSMALALAAAAMPAVGQAQTPVDATVGSLQEVPFGTVTPNPTGIRTYYYVPAGATAPMPVVVGLHGCEGRPALILSWLKAQADTYGFMLALPDVNRHNGSTRPADVNGCWDVGSDDALAAPPDNDSDPTGILALVDYVGSTLRCGDAACGDMTKVFATGQSSGAMMTNVLLGLYPDRFEAGAAFMGVPFGCWASGVGGPHPAAATGIVYDAANSIDQWGAAAGWSSACANGTVKHTPAEWAALLPAYDGARPRMMLWHGAKDTLINYGNFGEAIEQWTQALGVGQTPVASDYPLASGSGSNWNKIWTRTRYGAADGQAPVEAISVSDIGHSVEPGAQTAAELVRFFGIGDIAAPAAPTGLTASSVTETGATLTWTAPTDDVAVTRYVVSRKDGATLTPVAWPTAASQALTGLSASTTYTYEVAAVDAAGNISPAASVELTTAAGSSGGGGGGGGCGQGVPSGAALILAAAALLLVRRRVRA